MFNFFKKFKAVSESDGDGKGGRERAGPSLVVPTKKRDDKVKDKIGSKEREVGVSSFDANKTGLAVSAGVKIKDAERKFGDVREPVSVQQRGEKNEPVIVKADDTYTYKSQVQGTSRVRVMGNTTATMTSSDDSDEIGKNRDLAKSAATHTDAEVSQDEKHQLEAAETQTDSSRQNHLASRATRADVTMVMKAQVEEQPAEGNELTQKIHDCEPSSSSSENLTAMDKLTNMEKQVEELQNEK